MSADYGLTEAHKDALRAQLASWSGDDRQAFLVSHLALSRVLERCEELKTSVAEHQWNALEMARKADMAERRAEEAEFHVEQLRDARDKAERRIERAERLIDSWEHDAPDHSNPVFTGRLRECLRHDPAPVRLRGEQHHHDVVTPPGSSNDGGAR